MWRWSIRQSSTGLSASSKSLKNQDVTRNYLVFHPRGVNDKCYLPWPRLMRQPFHSLDYLASQREGWVFPERFLNTTTSLTQTVAHAPSKSKKPQKSRWKFNYLLSWRMSLSPYLLGHWPSGGLGVQLSLLFSNVFPQNLFILWHRRSVVITTPSRDFSRALRGTLMGFEIKTSTVFKEK